MGFGRGRMAAKLNRFPMNCHFRRLDRSYRFVQCWIYIAAMKCICLPSEAATWRRRAVKCQISPYYSAALHRSDFLVHGCSSLTPQEYAHRSHERPSTKDRKESRSNQLLRQQSRKRITVRCAPRLQEMRAQSSYFHRIERVRESEHQRVEHQGGSSFIVAVAMSV